LSNTSCGNETQRQATFDKLQAILKLKDAGSSLVYVLGTPWHEDDSYARIIRSNEQAAEDEKNWAIKIDPAFKLKQGFEGKLTAALLPTVTPADIDSFLFPERLDWKFLRSEILSSPALFLSQNLCIFPRDISADLKLQFDRDSLENATRPLSFFDAGLGGSRTVLSFDRAFETGPYSDMSVVTAGRIQVVNGKNSLVILDCQMGRWKPTELVRTITQMTLTHNPITIVAEKDRGWEDFGISIRTAIANSGHQVPTILWQNIPSGGRNAGAKMKRMKALEMPLGEDRLWFVSSALWNDQVFNQFVDLGVKKRPHDDMVDAISMIWGVCVPKQHSAETVDTKAQAAREKAEEDAYKRAQREEFLRNTFGDSYGGHVSTARTFGRDINMQPDAEALRPQNPLDKVFGNNGLSVGRKKWGGS
jgi:phage terminase large subunit-like protein